MFKFPRVVFTGQNTLAQQFQHIRSEIREIWKELEPGYPDNFDPKRTALELMDLNHSSETGLRILQEQYGVDLDEVQREHDHKNRVRGYYAD